MPSFQDFGSDPQHCMQAIFTSIFILQNRLQTAGEKIQTDISMKQWLLLALATTYHDTCTLTQLGTIMGCSRQNVKKLASSLEKKGFLQLTPGRNNSVIIEFNEIVGKYLNSMSERHQKTFELLFQDFKEEEITELFRLYSKLYQGIERVEQYADELHK